MTAETPETRRGLPVKRPKGKPFSYTVERRKRDPFPMEVTVRIKVDGYWSDDTVRCEAHPGFGEKELPPMTVAYNGGGQDSTDYGLATVENFASALRWAVGYARRWNKKHGLTPASPVG